MSSDLGTVVLVAEDDPEFRRLLRQSLLESGFRVEEATDGEACLARLSAGEPPDFVVCDVRMPRMTGLEVLHSLRREDRKLPPFVLITGFGDPEIHDQAAMLGAVATLDKPFDLEELTRIVLTHLDARSP